MASKFQQMGKLSLAVLLASLVAGCASTGDQDSTASQDKAASQEAKPVVSETSTAASAKQNTNQIIFAIPWMRLDPATGRFYMQWVMWPNTGEYITPQQTPTSGGAK